MDNEKIGRFITEQRKSHELTQKELAEKLNVTDKAVSKWERGLSYPDISLLLPLSDTLGVSVNELLNGEKSADTEDKEEAKTAIENVLQYADKAVKTQTRSVRKRSAMAIVVAMFLVAGAGLMFYPVFARRWNARIQHGIVQEYYAAVNQIFQDELDEHFRRAEEFNARLRDLPSGAPFLVGHMATLPEDYNDILNVNGVMAHVEIPAINVNLPVFHGSESTTLQRGVGHLEGTAFPTGGYSNHTVLTAFNGLSHARMFTDLDQLREGDIFFITVLFIGHINGFPIIK